MEGGFLGGCPWEGVVADAGCVVRSTDKLEAFEPTANSLHKTAPCDSIRRLHQT